MGIEINNYNQYSIISPIKKTDTCTLSNDSLRERHECIFIGVDTKEDFIEF